MYNMRVGCGQGLLSTSNPRSSQAASATGGHELSVNSPSKCEFAIFATQLLGSRKKPSSTFGRGEDCHVHAVAERYTRSPLEDSRLLGPSPWKVLATAYG